jgi:hypothetical protein
MLSADPMSFFAGKGNRTNFQTQIRRNAWSPPLVFGPKTGQGAAGSNLPSSDSLKLLR